MFGIGTVNSERRTQNGELRNLLHSKFFLLRSAFNVAKQGERLALPIQSNRNESRDSNPQVIQHLATSQPDSQVLRRFPDDGRRRLRQRSRFEPPREKANPRDGSDRSELFHRQTLAAHNAGPELVARVGPRATQESLEYVAAVKDFYLTALRAL